MAKPLFRKIIEHVINQRQFYLVNVCAWCPKNSYPKLHIWQKYTHGICQKHYLQVSKKQANPPLQEIVNRLIASLWPKTIAREY